MNPKSDESSDILNQVQAPSLAMMNYFTSISNAKLSEMISEANKYSVMQASIGNLIGTGRGQSRFVSTVKAIAECLERKFFEEHISDKKDILPFYKKNTNGYAVHFNSDEAIESAKREALERHILQVTFLKHGWDGFYLLKRDEKSDLKMTYVVSKYEVNHYSAGIVLTQSVKYPGVALGYFCDKTDKLNNSNRLSHAESESIDKIEPILNLVNEHNYKPTNNIDEEMFKWFFEKFEMPKFNESLQKEDLPDLELNIELFNLKEKWNLDFPFFASKCDGENLMPLLIPRQGVSKLDSHLKKLFDFYKIDSSYPLRNPIL